jgi:hypothetical protein
VPVPSPAPDPAGWEGGVSEHTQDVAKVRAAADFIELGVQPSDWFPDHLRRIADRMEQRHAALATCLRWLEDAAARTAGADWEEVHGAPTKGPIYEARKALGLVA